MICYRALSYYQIISGLLVIIRSRNAAEFEVILVALLIIWVKFISLLVCSFCFQVLIDNH